MSDSKSGRVIFSVGVALMCFALGFLTCWLYIKYMQGGYIPIDLR